jgi:type IX secretion system PorP/SprF family membrane protein
MKAIFCSLLLAQTFIFCCPPTFAQNFPVYSSYSTNHYLYNPAEAATPYTFVFVNHRQQWTGIEGMPQLSTLNITTLLDQTRVGLGLKISSYQRGLLTTSDAQATFAYGVPVGKEDEVYFGISGGMISNSIDQAKISDPTDPAVANYLANNLYPVGSAGFVYKSKTGINFGASLPQFIGFKKEGELFTPDALSPFDQVFVTLYYRKKLGSHSVYKRVRGVRRRVKAEGGYSPIELYTVYKYSAYQTSQFESVLKLNLSENFWIGGGYRQSYGLIGSTGFSIKNFAASYSYEPGGQPESGFSAGTHEIQVGVRLGNPKSLKRKAPVLQSTLTTTAQHHDPRLKHSDSDPLITEQKDNEQTDGKFYLVVIKVFTEFNRADEYKNELIKEKFNAEIFYNQKDRRFYVYTLKTSKSHDANEEARNLKTYTKLKEAHVVAFDEK